MAKAKLSEPKPSVHLDLTHEEAQFLRDVTGHIGGPPKSRRQYADAIARALREVGIDGTEGFDVDRTNCAIYFTVKNG